jgi:S-adenosylmethionine:tRNA ribosyltransferase-isomerase
MENIHVWKVLANPGKHVLNGMKIKIAEDFCCEVILKEKDGTILVQFEYDDSLVRQKANKYGHVPVPPYVKQEPGDLSAYQTIYAKNEGSVAAPTAGFHFTDDLIEKMEKIGVEFSDLTLHVGLGTFLPVKSEKIEEHVMHSEWAQLTQEEAEKINLAKKQSRRIIAIGTTTTRALEGIAKYCLENNKNVLSGFDGEINIFIYPGFKFNIVDAMITNFHLPKSTLLMLVCAFAGDSDFMLKCYKKAVDEKYRFYSFGDGMIIN